MSINIAQRFLLCLMVVCVATLPTPGQRPRPRAQQQRQTRSGPAQSSPASLARAYAAGLAADNFSTLWQHAAFYSYEVREAVKDLPRSMWPDKIRLVQEKWLSEIHRERAGTNLNSELACWVYFRPGVKYEFLEDRGDVAFFSIRYPSESVSPLFKRGGLRKLEKATLIMRNIAFRPNCDIVEGTASYFSPPALAKEKAIELTLAALRPNFQPSVDFRPQATPYLEKSKYGDFLNLLKKHGIESSKPRFIFGSDGRKPPSDQLVHITLAPPPSWERYRLPLQHWAGMPVYALAESHSFELVSHQPVDEDTYTTTLRIGLEGCTPICAFIRDLTALLEGSSNEIFWSAWNDAARRNEWPRAITIQATLTRDSYDSWRVRGYR